VYQGFKPLLQLQFCFASFTKLAVLETFLHNYLHKMSHSALLKFIHRLTEWEDLEPKEFIRLNHIVLAELESRSPDYKEQYWFL
jgi:hypothetical protein